MIIKKISFFAASIISLLIIQFLFLNNSNSQENNSKRYSEDSGILSIMYHRFNENKYPSTNIKMDIFDQQMKSIKELGYEFYDPKLFISQFGEPKKNKLREVIGNGRIVLFGLPGAFTSTCSKLHLPGFVANADKIKAKGIENIFCLSVNDPYVMNGWGEINNTGDKIKMLSDPYLLFTKAIGAEVDRNAKGMGIRSNRYLMVIENFTIVNIHVEKETKECGLTSAENLLNNLI